MTLLPTSSLHSAERSDAGLGDDIVLMTAAAAHPDGADELAIDDQRQAARRCAQPVERQEELVPGGEDIREHPGRPPVLRRRLGLGDREPHRCVLRVVHLHEMHQRAVYGFLRARLLEPADAEDLCQEVFLRCYLGREKFARAPAVRPWLFGIARNLLREHVRRITRRKEVAWTEMCLELDALIETRDEHDEDALAHLPACLDSLGKSAREALDLLYQARLKLGEIGEKLNVVSATLTFHLKKLIRGGFVRPPERHRLDYYTVNFTRISAVIAFFLNSSCARMPTDDFAQIRMALKRCRQRGTARPIGTRKT